MLVFWLGAAAGHSMPRGLTEAARFYLIGSFSVIVAATATVGQAAAHCVPREEAQHNSQQKENERELRVHGDNYPP
jgi:hypothetical protein